DLVWSPDSRRVVVTAPEQPQGTAPTDPVVVSRLGSKLDGAGRLGPLTVHLHLVDIETADIVRLTDGDLVVRDPAWSPDGTTIAIATAQHPDRDRDGVSHLFTVETGSGDLRQVTDWDGTAAVPVWSSDGGSLVFAGSVPPLRSGHTRLWRVPASGGKPEELAPDLDRNVMVGGPAYPGARPRLTADGDVVFCVRDRGAVHLVSVPLAGGDVRTLVGGDAVVSGTSQHPLVCLLATDHSTADLHLVANCGLRRISFSNSAFFDKVEIATAEPRQFYAPDGLPVHGWLIGRRDGAPQPLLLDVHGGPHNAWGPAFDPVHAYHQLLAAQGWVVLTLNPRGSDGYGEQFWTAAHGAWGRADADDLLSAVDALVEQAVADPHRLAVTGYSYGGYMTCWLTTKTDRFAAAVPGGVVTDLVSFSGTSDVAGLFDVSEFGASATQDPALLRDLSPLTGVRAVRTPTLIVHGDADDRCPVGQAEQWFTALRTLGREVEMVLYPGASHLFVVQGRPSHRADWNRRVTDWVTGHAPAQSG
ncbi:MAG: S9 family peptidase, partial [Actinobacteria bacterium]|nr:S9 family peptidase [Actinomycetota bacterium]